MIGTPTAVSTRLLRRPMRLRALAAAAVVVLAACETSTPHKKRATTAPTQTTAAPTTTTTTPRMTYTVKRGDTVTSIAKYFGLSTAALLAANQLGNADRITEGQVLTIPPAPPAGLTVTPSEAPPGQEFKFSVTGAKAGEMVVFEINTPSGGKFTGQPHTASQEGVASASYNSSGDNPGAYKVVARGDRGTTLEATYRVLG